MTDDNKTTDIRSLSDLRPDIRNANKGTLRGRSMIDKSLREVGAGRSIVADRSGNIVAGNKTLEAWADIGGEIEVVRTDGKKLVVVQREDLDLTDDTGAARRLAYLDNRAGEVGLDWDVEELLRSSEAGVKLDDIFDAVELEALLIRANSNSGGGGGDMVAARATLAERFGIPPFSVLDARQGYWQDRKRAWLGLGIQSELGRGEAVTWGIEPDGTGTGDNADKAYTDAAKKASPGGSPRPATKLGEDGKTVRGDGRGREFARTFGQDIMRGEHVVGEGKQKQHVNGVLMTSDSGNDPAYYFKKQEAERRLGRELTTEEFQRDYYEGPDTYASGTSIFDPVLCELAYTWFCMPGGRILDPFAGGSVRGIVAAELGRKYTGVDLRAEQIDANIVQAKAIVPGNVPTWIVGDSSKDLPDGEFDFVFSCPPYADLEVYSDDPADISTMDYADFLAVYRSIIAQAVARLADNRFACFVVGDVRDKKGNYHNFVSDTIAAFADAGAHLYNEAILVTAVGSLPIRVGKQFETSRKLGKTHQNVLVFVKGEGRKAADACGKVEVVDLADQFGEVVE